MNLTPDPLPPEAEKPRRPWPRRMLTIVGLWGVITILVFGILGGGNKGGPQAGSAAVMMKVPQLGASAPFDMATLKGKTVLLDFWATHCGPCKKTLPALQAVYQRYKDDPKVVIMSVNLDMGAQRVPMVSRYMQSRKLSFPVLMDTGALANAYNVQFIPLLVVVDPDGKVMKAEVGIKGQDVGSIVTHLVRAVEAARGPSS